MREIKPLTSLRGLFALWVIVFHIRYHTDIPWAISSRGYLGVDFFFMLSGFVLAGSYGRRFLAPNKPQTSYFPFIVARLGRLLPLHLAVMLVMVLIGAPVGSALTPPLALLREATLTQTWNLFTAEPPTINGVAWSISTEWGINLIFPALVALTMGHSHRIASIAIVFAVAGLLFIASLHGWSVDIWGTTSFRQMARCLCEFTLGLVAFRYKDRLPFLKSDYVLLILWTGIVVAVIAKAGDLLIVALMFPALLAAAGNNGWGKKSLSVKPAHWVGTISYSIYLTQMPIIRFMESIVPESMSSHARSLMLIGSTIAGSILVSSLTYRIIEVPARDLVKSWSNRVLARSAA